MNDPITTRLAQIFLRASQALGDRMLEKLKEMPEIAAQLTDAAAQGEHVSIALHFGDEPRIELASLSDYGTTRRFASIPLTRSDSVLRNH